MKKIAMLCDFFNEDLAYQENILYRYFTKRGFDCRIICCEQNDLHSYYANQKITNKKNNFYEKNKDIIRKKYFLKLGSLKLLSGIYEELEKYKPDYIYAHDINLSLIPVSLYKSRNPDIVMIADNHCDSSNSAKNIFSRIFAYRIVKNLVLKFTKKSIDKIYCVTDHSIKFMNDMYGFDDSKFMPLCVDNNYAKNLKRKFSRDEIINEFNLPKDKKIFFTGGRLNKEKMTLELIDFVKNRNNSYLVIVGSPNSKEYAKEINHAVNDCANTKYLGWQDTDTISKLLYVSDLSLFPGSQSAMWQHSLSFNTPIVITDYSGSIGSMNPVPKYYRGLDCILVLKGKNCLSEELEDKCNSYFENKDLENKSIEDCDNIVEGLLNYDTYLNWIK